MFILAGLLWLAGVKFLKRDTERAATTFNQNLV